MPVFSHQNIIRIKEKIRSGGKFYSVLIDGVTYIERTDDPDKIDTYTDYWDEESQEITFKIYQGSSYTHETITYTRKPEQPATVQQPSEYGLQGVPERGISLEARMHIQGIEFQHKLKESELERRIEKLTDEGKVKDQMLAFRDSKIKELKGELKSSQDQSSITSFAENGLGIIQKFMGLDADEEEPKPQALGASSSVSEAKPDPQLDQWKELFTMAREFLSKEQVDQLNRIVMDLSQSPAKIETVIQLINQ